MAQRAIFLQNDFTATYNVKRFTPTPAPASYRAATGLTTLRAKLCVLPDLDAPAIHPLLDLLMVEDSGTPGFYFATFDGGDLDDYLAPYVGQTVYLVLYYSESLYIVEPLKVFDKRRAALAAEVQ